MGEITVSQSLGEKIFEKMRALTADHLPAFTLGSGLISIHPEKASEVATALRVGVTSDDSQLIENAFSAMLRWLEEASECDSQVPQPPDDLVREIGIAIASRRNTGSHASTTSGCMDLRQRASLPQRRHPKSGRGRTELPSPRTALRPGTREPRRSPKKTPALCGTCDGNGKKWAGRKNSRCSMARHSERRPPTRSTSSRWNTTDVNQSSATPLHLCT